MKKALLVSLSLLLLALPLVLAACGSGISKSDLNVIRSLPGRIDGNDSAIASIRGDINQVKTDVGQLKNSVDNKDDYNALKGDIADLEEELSGVKDSGEEVTALKAELASLKAELTKLETAVTALTTPPAGSTPAGQVVVTIDPGTPLSQVLSSSAGTNPSLFRVTIANGTATYQYVSYSVVFVLLNPAVPAAVTAAPTLSLSGGIFGAPSYSFTPVLVPAATAYPTTNTQQVIFVPGGATPKIPVAAGQSLTIYHMLDLKTAGMALWQGSITGTVATATP